MRAAAETPEPPPPKRIEGPILVTGATGFIGRRLVHRLLQEGYRPHLFVRPRSPLEEAWEGLPIERGDVTELDTVHRAMRGVGTVFHLAAKVGDWGTEAEHQGATVRGTEHVLGEAARAEARVLLASSLVVYGEQLGRTVCDEHLPLGRKAFGPYGRAKQAQERAARDLEAKRGLRVTIIRPANVFGPGSVTWVDAPVEVFRQGLPGLIGDGNRDAGLTYVDNVVDVFVRAAERPDASGRIYNANDENGVTWRRYFSELADLVGAKRPKSLPAPVARIFAKGAKTAWDVLGREGRAPLTPEALQILSAHHRVPIARARRELGYRPAVSYEQAMDDVAKYLAERGLSRR